MPQDQPSISNCFTAQTSPNVLGNLPMNPDVGGFAVGISNIIINICLSILLKWSKPSGAPPLETGTLASNQCPNNIEPGVSVSTLSTTSALDTKSLSYMIFQSSAYGEELIGSVYGLFYQVYPILLATAACIGRQHLTLFEAHFALAISASPISVYLAWGAFRYALCNPTNTRTAVALWLSLFLPFFWLLLNFVVSFHTDAFINSHLCKDMNLAHWFEFQMVSNFVGILDVMGRRDLWSDLHGRGGLGAVSVAMLWVWGVYFVHHRSDIVEAIKTARRKYDDQPLWRCWPLHVWAILKTPWNVIRTNHPWLFFVIVCCLHWSWILGIVQGMSLNEYQFTYGQALSIFSTLSPVVAVLKLACARWRDACKFFMNSPPGLRDEIIFIFVGKWDTTYSGRSRNLSFLCIHAIVSLLFSSSLAIYIWRYVIAGSIPNPRTAVNNPHQNWKPFSIGVYISGFLIGCFNVWFWSEYCVRVAGWLNSRSVRPWIKNLLWFVHIPLALFMCLAPLFSPFAALPLAQEQQWTHRCDLFAGEAILEGRSYIFQPPRASLHYTYPGNSANIEYEYIINYHSHDANIWTFELKNTSFIGNTGDSGEYYSLVRSISYDLNRSTMAATCMTINSPTPFPCMWGHYDHDHFSIFLNDTHTLGETKLRAVDKEWHYSDDAPSFTLNKLGPDGQPSDMVMQSAVTKRNHCELLKICLSLNPPGLEILAPLGLVLWAEDRYTTYCTTPRLYG